MFELVFAALVASSPQPELHTQRILVATAHIPRGAPVSSNNTRTALRSEVAFPRHRRPHVVRPRERLRARRALRVGAVISKFDVEPMPDIVAKDPVVVEMTRGPVRVTANAVAVEDGFTGQTIWVQNVASKRRLRVRIVETGRVVVLGMFGDRR